MAVFVIAETEVLDENLFNDYRRLAAASVSEHGGRYLARGAEAHVVEGEPSARRIVIIEFPSMQRAREWYTSSSYSEALKLRAAALDRRLTFVEGVSPSD